MKEIYLLRHAESDMTLGHFYCGISDPPLCEKGIETAVKAGEKIKGIKFDRVISSPLLRCQMTARYALGEETVKDMTFDERLREMNFGNWEGQKFSSDRENRPDELEKYRKNWPDFTFPGGDYVIDYFWKAGKTLMEYLEEETEKTTVLVTHWGFIGSAIGSLTHKDPARVFNFLVMPPCACFKITKTGKDSIEYLELI